MKQLLLLTILFVLFVTSAFASLNQQEVVIYPQPDSPLQLSNVVPKWSVSKDPSGREWNMLDVEFVTQNVSNKSIRAYTIRQFEGEFNIDIGAMVFSFTLSAKGCLQPRQTGNESLGAGSIRDKSKTIKLAVDFVEFTDGSIWGQDLSHSAQQLAGVSAGLKAGQEHLLKINKENGIEAVIKATDESQDISPSNEQSDIWKRGFKTGYRTIKRQIKRVYEKEGIKAVEIELQKQFFPHIDK